MSGISIGITLEDRQVQRLIRKMTTRAAHLEPALKSIGEYMQREREGWFQREEDPEGKPWQPLKVRTYYRKKGNKILTRDHHLRRTVYRLGIGMVTISPDKTSKDYALIHQKGGKAGRGHKAVIPARVHMGVTTEHRREFVEIVKEHLLQ
jgi:phage virion morphogenesis protein